MRESEKIQNVNSTKKWNRSRPSSHQLPGRGIQDQRTDVDPRLLVPSGIPLDLLI